MLVALGAARASAVAQTPDAAFTRPSPVIPFDAHSLGGWTIDARAKRPPVVADGVISLGERSGWLRTQQTQFRTFTLRFSVRVTSPKARAVVALIGTSEPRNERAYAVLLTGGALKPRSWPSALLNLYLPDERARREAWSQDEWQRFEITRFPDRVMARLNDRLILNIESPVTLDGWLGFRVQDGTMEIRDVALGDAPPAAPPAYFPMGPGITAPVVTKEQKPSYTREAMRQGIQGEAWIEAVVDVDGTVKRPVVVRFLDPNYGLDREAVRAVSGWRFKPGMRDGVPVPVLITVAVSFKLQ